MSYLVITFRFSYSDVMEMEHLERVKWLDLANEHNKEKANAYERAGKGK